MPEPTKEDMRRAMQETINEEVIGRIDAEERAEAAEALNTRYREALERIRDDGEANPQAQHIAAAALSSPADSQEQDG